MKVLLYIVSTILFAIAVVFGLAYTSNKKNDKKNGFDRNFNHEVRVLKSIDNKYGWMDISGITQNQLFFNNRNPKQLFVSNYNLENIQRIMLNEDSGFKKLTSFHIKIDSPTIYMYSVNNKALYTGNLNTGLIKAVNYSKPSFTRLVPISNQTVMLRRFDTTKAQNQIFTKMNTESLDEVIETNISEKKGDAGFSTDGFLHYDRKNKLLLYVYVYQNEILVLDTSLNLIKKLHTIDTTSLSKISVGKLTDENEAQGEYTTNTPRYIINASNFVDDGILYNYAKLRADNESTESFANNSVIDMYEIRSGSYIGSLYIPFYKGKRMLRFLIKNNLLIVLYKESVIVYSLV